jgi:hypothetical protein
MTQENLYNTEELSLFLKLQSRRYDNPVYVRE